MFIITVLCGCSSVVERHVANVNVVSSSLITRFKNSISEVSAKFSLALVADMSKGPDGFGCEKLQDIST